MPAPPLPDELVSEILSPALRVSDEVFADTTHVSPFASSDSESTSAYLLVCKSWLRVATPLLYSVVILRSKAQAKALGLVLSGNNLLGPFIHKIRVEGGYGAPLGTILKCSPNITDLFMTLGIWGNDSTIGLCKGLTLISPTRLILKLDGKRSSNKMSTKLQDALLEAIPKWDRLTVAEFSNPVTSLTWDQRPIEVVFEALGNSKRLERLVISPHSIFQAYPKLKACPLKVIQIRGILSKSISLQLDAAPDIKALVQFSEKPLDLPCANVDPEPLIQSWSFSRNPLNAASQDVQESIWKRVLYFAMFVSEPEELRTRDRLAHRKTAIGLRATPSRLPFLLVSKTFNRLALPYYYAHTHLRNTMTTSKFAALLQRHPAVASQVRTLYGALSGRDYSHLKDPEGDELAAAAALLAVFSQTTGLEQVSERLKEDLEFNSNFVNLEGPSITWDAFEAMANSSGKTLQQFTKPIATESNISTEVFAKLTALRVLNWVCVTSFICDPAQTRVDGLPSLTTLQLTRQHPSFLIALKQMNLPSLRTLRLGNHDDETDDFLRVHGSKLTEVVVSSDLDKLEINIFEVCPNLSLITILMDPDVWSARKALNPKHFSSKKTTGCSLEKIQFEISYWSMIKDYIAAWETAFTGFNPQFPNLREIQIDQCEWPTNEREITKSYWVRWAEMLLKHNINLTDKSGKKWRPRLKV
ncbi:hypothetical protein C8F04DRAFT_1077833 [Mycena alexandri]|uniref:Uncharacterized protein n=1 Tax=Mycena alexandri TaxID=1745969 RepID=A0AAD6TDI4_9AGAR|nr:hypothetical protein C8F04DRAFT_1077833 [Mycena alexandri]